MLFPNPVQLNFADRSIIEAKPIYFGFREAKIYVIGCGGTGSFLVPHLCRVADFLSQYSRQIKITLVDYDFIEEKNLYRQNFCRGELGWNKAEALAMRYRSIYPKLDIVALASDSNYLALRHYSPSIIIGCVDNAEARKSIANLVFRNSQVLLHKNEDNSKPLWWIDCGNDLVHGQVAIGNLHSTHVEDYKLEPLVCTRLPFPTLQYPQLLEDSEEKVEPVSCADMAILGGQSLNINCHMAAIAAEMVTQLFQSQLKRMNVEIDIFRGSMRSTFIVQEHIDRTVTRAREVLGEVK